MRKTDINRPKKSKLSKSDKLLISSDLPRWKIILNMISKVLLTIVAVFLITGTVAMISIVVYVISLSADHIDYDLVATKLHLTSIIYVNDQNGNPKEYDKISGTENRLWVDFSDIPQNMKDAVIAIEDKRFREHNGVDWIRTGGAVISLVTGKETYGGSTLTQQLIKNLTEDNEVSLTRKIREIFRALNFEKKYSKDEILEAYLNVVNFGNNCRGVEAAANTYFGKSIGECSVAQCAAIAGITQNPTAFNPLIYPDNNKQRRETIIKEMYSQNMITEDEYNAAMDESQNMQFVKYYDDEENNNKNSNVRSWYVDALYNDIKKDLEKKLGMGEGAAQDMILTQGLQIYAGLDPYAQDAVERITKNPDRIMGDKNIQLGFLMMDYDGRIIATVGGRGEKEGNLLFDRANEALRQPGSTIKPIAVYAPLVDMGVLNYSSIVKDEPIELNGKKWPENAYKTYKGNITLQHALQVSSNAAAVQCLKILTPQKSYDFLQNKLKFAHLRQEDLYGYTAFATGGMTEGVTVREMAAAFQIFGNGGKFNEPYTYFKVLDRNGKVLLDNTNKTPIQAISSQTATVMNRLLRTVVTSGTGASVDVSGWDIVGKTGTTDENYDGWFIGDSPYAVAGLWIGYDNPKSMPSYETPKLLWKAIMTEYLSGKTKKNFTLDSTVKTATYCEVTGRLADTGICGPKKTGYYAPNNMPGNCGGNHSVFDSNINKENSEEQQATSSAATSSSSSSNAASSNASSAPSQSTSSAASEPEVSSSTVPGVAR